MRFESRLASIFLVLFFVSYWADAESADLIGMTRRAAELCKAGGDASAALQELLAAVESEYGADHEAAQLVRLYGRLALRPRSGS